ncbi:MAG: hypothetical protein IJ059_06350 [Prevotella sp.]|nr:hypothetical protein [Prevotella sp.]
MKNCFKYVMMGLTALVGTVSFSGCSSSDEVDINPGYDPETGRVKTEFVFNVTQPEERTRQTAEVVGNGVFQGINDMYLFCFDGTPGSSSAIDANHTFALDDFGKPEPTHSSGTPNSSKVYTLFIPTGTKNFLFYGTVNDAEKSGQPGYYGKLSKTYTNAGSVNDIAFRLVNQVGTSSDFTAPQTTLAAILNGIVGTSITTPADVKWATTSGSSNANLAVLGQTYEKFVGQANDGDIRQGSSTAVRNMVGDLFEVVNEIYTKTTDATAKALSEAILQKIGENFTVTASGSPAVYKWEDSYKSGTSSAVSNYPSSLGVPEGCAILEFNKATGQFAYRNSGAMVSKVSVEYSDVTYPAELTYYCNSGIWQSVVAKEAASYPKSAGEWAKADSWTSGGWDGNAVSASTRAVAMKENITYGVSQLKATIQRNIENTFTDNAAVINGGTTSDNVFSGTGENGISFTITGILIGGQPDVAQYEYLPKSTAFNKVIYDQFPDLSISQLPASDNDKTVTNYTLVLDNFTVGETQSKVYIALEVMADQDFYGLSGFIKAGQKFYLIGELDPLSASLDPVDWSKQTSFESGDTGYGKDRVFIRDAVTTAKFTISKDALKRAYSTIPDLRSTQMFFGLSVDLEWKAGLNFNVIIE